MAKGYKVQMADGQIVTIDGVTSVEKTGAGLRLLDAAGRVVAGFDDGQAKAFWPAAARVKAAPAT